MAGFDCHNRLPLHRRARRAQAVGGCGAREAQTADAVAAVAHVLLGYRFRVFFGGILRFWESVYSASASHPMPATLPSHAPSHCHLATI